MLAGAIDVRQRGDGLLQHHIGTPGTIWLCPAGVRKDMLRVRGDAFDAVHIFLPSQLLSDTLLENYDIDPDSVCMRYDGGFHDPLIEQIGLGINRELEQGSPDSELIIDSLKTALAAYLLKQHSSATHRVVSSTAVGALDPQRLKRVKDYINEGIGQSLRLSDLASQAQLSPFHFSRAFKLATGLKPHAYVLHLRVEKAKCLIQQARQPLCQIADKTGFSSQAHMSKVFRKVTGLSPKEFKRSL